MTSDTLTSLNHENNSSISFWSSSEAVRIRHRYIGLNTSLLRLTDFRTEIETYYGLVWHASVLFASIMSASTQLSRLARKISEASR